MVFEKCPYLVKLLLISICFLFQTKGITRDFADPITRDSLVQIVTERTHHDTVVLSNYIFLGHWYLYKNPDSAIYYIEEGLLLADSLNHSKGQSACYGILAHLNSEKGKYKTAIDYNLKALYLAEKEGQRNSPNYLVLLNNLADLNNSLENYEQALTYLKTCSELNLENGNTRSLSANYHNMALAYRNLNELDTAILYYQKAIEIRENIDHPKGLAFSYRGLGDVYLRQNLIDSVYYYYEKSRAISAEHNIQKSLASSDYKLGNLLFNDGELSKAKSYALEAYEICNTHGFTYVKSETALVLFKIFKAENNPQKALFFHEEYAQLKDSLNSLDNKRAIIESEFRFEYDKKRVVDSLEQEKIKIEALLLKEENSMMESKVTLQRLWLLVSILAILLLVILLIAIRTNARNKMQALRSEIQLRLNETITLEKKITELNQKEAHSKDINLVLHDKLTEREKAILDLLVLGLSNREIGEKLFVSVNTVKTHILSLYSKLDVSNRTQAAVKGNMLQMQGGSL